MFDENDTGKAPAPRSWKGRPVLPRETSSPQVPTGAGQSPQGARPMTSTGAGQSPQDARPMASTGAGQPPTSVSPSELGQKPQRNFAPTGASAENPFLVRARSEAAAKIAQREQFLSAIGELTPQEKAEILRSLINQDGEE